MDKITAVLTVAVKQNQRLAAAIFRVVELDVRHVA